MSAAGCLIWGICLCLGRPQSDLKRWAAFLTPTTGVRLRNRRMHSMLEDVEAGGPFYSQQLTLGPFCGSDTSPQISGLFYHVAAVVKQSSACQALCCHCCCLLMWRRNVCVCVCVCVPSLLKRRLFFLKEFPPVCWCNKWKILTYLGL